MKANQAAFEIGQMAERLAAGYNAHIAAIQIAGDPSATSLSPQVEPGKFVPEGYVFRKDGTFHNFHFNFYLAKVSNDPLIVDNLARVWLVGSLLTLGDALADNLYFDHAPELELLYHLRNGVAHGNCIHFTDYGKRRLGQYPAHNRLAWVKSDTQTAFEIDANLQGQVVLFDFIGPGDVLDLIMSIGVYLIRMGNGDPLRPVP
jgi:hypothetical protein